MATRRPKRVRSRRECKRASSRPAPPARHFVDPTSDQLLDLAADAIAEEIGERMAIEDLIAWGELEPQ